MELGQDLLGVVVAFERVTMLVDCGSNSLRDVAAVMVIGEFNEFLVLLFGDGEFPSREFRFTHGSSPRSEWFSGEFARWDEWDQFGPGFP